MPLQRRTLLKRLRTRRAGGSLLGLERRLLALPTFSPLDSRACRFCRMRELAMAAAM